jgi:hypothetical protein
VPFRSPTVRMPAVMARSAHCRAACQNISRCLAQQKRLGEPPRRGVSGWRQAALRCRLEHCSAGQGFLLTVRVHRGLAQSAQRRAFPINRPDGALHRSAKRAHGAAPACGVNGPIAGVTIGG